MRGRHKAWAAPFIAAHNEIAINSIDPNDHFFSSPLFLEIGGGKGDFILGLSSLKTGHFVVLERDISVCGTLVKKLVENEIKNVRAMALDFDEAFPSLNEVRFDAIYLNFSDPWPKKRHEKRRLTYAPRLMTIASLLKEEGKIFIKTDNDILWEFSKEQVPLANLIIESETFDYAFDKDSDAMSEYERNFRNEGKPIHRMILVKK